MKRNSEKQYDENQQMAFWPEELSNEGHVYAALGVSEQELYAWMQQELQLAQQKGNCDTVAAPDAADQSRWLSEQLD